MDRLFVASGFLLASLLAAGFLIALALSFTDARSGGARPAFVGLSNYLDLLHSQAFRNAVKNTLVLYVRSQAVAAVLAFLTVGLVATKWRGRTLFLFLFFLPFAIPVPLAALAWRQLGDSLGMLDHPASALTVAAALYAWRVWPLATLALTLVARRSLKSYALALLLAASAGAYWIFTDAATMLVLTGGEPISVTHLWASWAFQNAYIGGDLGASAAMAVGLSAVVSPALAAGVWAVHQLRKGGPVEGQSTLDDSRGGLYVTVFRVAWALVLIAGAALPLLSLLPSLRIQDVSLLFQTPYLRWLLNTALLALVIWLASGWLTKKRSQDSSARLGEDRRNSWLSVFSFWLGLAAMPVSYVALIWLRPSGGSWLWLAAVPLAGCLVLVGPQIVRTMNFAGLSGSASGSPISHLRLMGTASILLAANAFVHVVVLDLAAQEQTASVGVVLGLWRTTISSPGVAAWAAVATTVCVGVACALFWRVDFSGTRKMASTETDDEIEESVSADR